VRRACLVSAVESAIRAAVVRIGAPGEGYDGGYEGRRGTFWGSGFFIAPGWVLTSAHVVGKGRGAVWRGEPVIGITTEDDEQFTGELACGLPSPDDPERPRSPWGDPDLALVRVLETPGKPQPNGLWLSDRSALTPAGVTVHGYSPSVDGPAYLKGAGEAVGGTGGPMTVQSTHLAVGCSGGPVVDRERGAVIGVNKGRPKDGSPFARATPITEMRGFHDAGPRAAEAWQRALRAHERHHRERFRGLGWSWPREQHGLERGNAGFTALDRVELYARFAELPPPDSAGQVLEIVKDTRRAVLRESHRIDVHRPRSWREGAGLLYNPRDGRPADAGESGRDLERAAVVLYAARVCEVVRRDGPAEELEAWVSETALSLSHGVIREEVDGILRGGAVQDTLPATPTPTTSATASTSATAEAPHSTNGPRTTHADVLVEIDPDLYGLHPWRIRLIQPDGQITSVRHNETGVARAELEGDIRSALADALDMGDIGEHLAAVDFVLPRELFDEPVELWRAREAGPEGFSEHTLPLGHRRRVALRDRVRRKAKAAPEWHRRWRCVAKGRLEAVPLCEGLPDAGHESPQPEDDLAAWQRLSSAPDHTVPVHCARVSSGQGAAALPAAFAAGHPAALWRRCSEQHEDCSGFFEGAAELLRSVGDADGPYGLRERVLVLRNQSARAGVSDAATAWAGQLVLLYDPPHGPQLPDGPLREPRLRH
jgi:hypothetical protein